MKLEDADSVLDLVGQLRAHAALDTRLGLNKPGAAYNLCLKSLKDLLAEIVARDAGGSK